MKTIHKFLMVALMMLLTMPTLLAQDESWMKAPQNLEKEIGRIGDTVSGGGRTSHYEYKYSNRNERYKSYKYMDNTVHIYSGWDLYKKLLKKAKERYGDKYPDFELRSFTTNYESSFSSGELWETTNFTYYSSAVVIIKENPLELVIDKVMQNVRDGARIAVDQVKVTAGVDKGEYKDQIVEILLDKGYKVVAKEYLEKLYEEQQNQQSGIYNDRTTVQENNISAVGYFLNVKLTETSLRIQIVNVSTGEYDGNATVKL